MDVTATVWTLLPPIIAIALALITKEVYSSLMIGILSGALLYTGFHPLKAVETTFHPSWAVNWEIISIFVSSLYCSVFWFR